MSTNQSETPDAIQEKIQQENLKYQQEFIKGSKLSIRKEIRVKIRELKTVLEKLLQPKDKSY